MTMPTAELKPTNAESDNVDDAGGTCAACAHAMADHDAIGTRFCSATLAGGYARGCVCVGGTTEKKDKK
jgi:hypothetical protein